MMTRKKEKIKYRVDPYLRPEHTLCLYMNHITRGLRFSIITSIYIFCKKIKYRLSLYTIYKMMMMKKMKNIKIDLYAQIHTNNMRIVYMHWNIVFYNAVLLLLFFRKSTKYRLSLYTIYDDVDDKK